MFCPFRRGILGYVITIRITCKEPPCGVVSADGLEEKPFEGWLGMMRVVSDYVDQLEVITLD